MRIEENILTPNQVIRETEHEVDNSQEFLRSSTSQLSTQRRPRQENSQSYKASSFAVSKRVRLIPISMKKFEQLGPEDAVFEDKLLKYKPGYSKD